MTRIAVGLSLCALLAAPRARADQGQGLQLALRSGFTLPLGDISGGGNNAFSDTFTGFIPFQLDAGYRFNPNVMVGAFFSYGLGLTKNCDPGASCSGSAIAAGLQAHYHFAPDGIDPWAGVGIGYEWLKGSQSGGDTSGDVSFRGVQFVNLQVGVDFPLASGFKLAPFVQLGIGQYASGSITTGGQTFDGDITNKAVHELLSFGVRAAFDL